MMVPVKSSAIEAIGYNRATRTMLVKFKGGAVHSYADVPMQAHANLMAAKSIGGHFHAHVRDAFKSTKL